MSEGRSQNAYTASEVCSRNQKQTPQIVQGTCSLAHTRMPEFPTEGAILNLSRSRASRQHSEAIVDNLGFERVHSVYYQHACSPTTSKCNFLFYNTTAYNSVTIAYYYMR